MSALIRFCLLSLFAPLAPAQDMPVVDTDLPQPFTPAVADQLVTQSPFTRIVNVEDTLQLTGVAYVDGRPVATFLNTATKERVTVSEEPNAHGWKITEAIPGTELHDTEVHVLIAGEEITMHYGNAQLTPGVSKKGAPGAYVARSGPGSSGSVKTSSFLGENGRELYVALSREARDKLREAVHSHIERHPERSQEQHSAYAQKIYAKIKAADQKSQSSNNTKSTKNSIKSGKPFRSR